jgi:hypothetical protein
MTDETGDPDPDEAIFSKAKSTLAKHIANELVSTSEHNHYGN